MSQKVSSVTETTHSWATQRGLACEFEAETGSTNDNAKKKALNEDEDCVLYLATHQSAGRGRGTHTWLDTGSGESLLATWSFATKSPPQAITGPRIGLALFKAASKTWNSLSWGLKPPNDLFLSGHKVAGLLVESVSSGSSHRLLVGLGFNVLNHPRKFAEATHLSAALSEAVDEATWFQFLDELQVQLQKAVEECQQPRLNEKSRSQLALAINANSARPFEVSEVTAEGDLIYKGGIKRWMDL